LHCFCPGNPPKTDPWRTTRTLTLPFSTGVFRADTVAGGNRFVVDKLDGSQGPGLKIEAALIGGTRVFINHDILL